jgi:hypothetical protein
MKKALLYAKRYGLVEYLSGTDAQKTATVTNPPSAAVLPTAVCRQQPVPTTTRWDAAVRMPSSSPPNTQNVTTTAAAAGGTSIATVAAVVTTVTAATAAPQKPRILSRTNSKTLKRKTPSKTRTPSRAKKS